MIAHHYQISPFIYSAVYNCRGSTLIKFRPEMERATLIYRATLISSGPRRKVGHAYLSSTLILFFSRFPICLFFRARRAQRGKFFDIFWATLIYRATLISFGPRQKMGHAYLSSTAITYCRVLSKISFLARGWSGHTIVFAKCKYLCYEHPRWT